MAKQSNSLTDRIDALLKQKKVHEKALHDIDAKLTQIERLLGGTVQAAQPTAAAKAPRSGRKPRGKFATSGEEMIISFVKKSNGATTKEINEAWRKEGRGGSADTPLSKLVKQKTLKRVAIEGKRGSTYEVM